MVLPAKTLSRLASSIIERREPSLALRRWIPCAGPRLRGSLADHREVLLQPLHFSSFIDKEGW
jgi:hypothetical protein